MSIFPSGEYKMIVIVQEKENHVFTATFVGQITSSNKDTFG